MQLSYSGPRLRGADCMFQEWAITPLSSNQYWTPNDVVKFMGNINTGLVDFYRSHIQFQIEVTSDMMPVGGIQLDNSAQSLISQTVLLSEQRQIQRIQDYDTLAAGLSDIGFSEILCQNRSGQGLGYNNVVTNQPGTNASCKLGQVSLDMSWDPSVETHPAYAVQNMTQGSFSPVVVPQYSGAGYQSNVSWWSPGSDVAYSSQVSSSLAGGNIQSFTNWLTFPLNTQDAVAYTTSSGRALAVRAEYNLSVQNCGYPDSPTSFPVTAPMLPGQNWNYSNMKTQGYDPLRPYSPVYGWIPPAVGNFTPIQPTTCGISGYTKPYAAQFCVGTNQPFLSPTAKQIQMVEGKILSTPIPLSRKTFRIPLISAILGILIPPDQFKLIPAASLKNLILQISLNPFAFFTSGYSDVHQLDKVGMQPSNMQKRTWRINSFQWVWHLYTFSDANITNSIQTQLARGISISSNMWQLQAQYQLPNGSYVRNSFQIPANVESLAQIWCIFLSNEYQTKSFCRKQFRLSNNITSMQFKANGAYYPLQPILGNAGNPQTVDTTGDNWPFYQTLLLSNNYLFNTNVPAPRINQKNFAINGRIYDSSNRATFLPDSLYNTNKATTYPNAYAVLNSFSTNPINYDTALGQSWFHENRYVGRAIFSYTFEPYGHSKTLINGLNTTNYRQFEITFNNSPNNVYPGDQTMYIFSRSNVLVNYTERGIFVLGT